MLNTSLMPKKKSSSHNSVGLLKPLPIPDRTWQMIKVDFITSLPCIKNGHTAKLVVVARLFRMTYLIPTTVHVTGEVTTRLLVECYQALWHSRGSCERHRPTLHWPSLGSLAVDIVVWW